MRWLSHLAVGLCFCPHAVLACVVLRLCGLMLAWGGGFGLAWICDLHSCGLLVLLRVLPRVGACAGSRFLRPSL
jgi:hypothetical protein